MKSFFRTGACAALVLTALSFSRAAHAAPILPGGTLFPAPPEPDPVGGAVVGSMAVPFASPTYSGTLLSTVIAGDVSNPLGGLTFTYRLFNDATSVNPLDRLTVNGYTGFLTDASFQAPPVGIPPTLINRSAPDVMGFTFADIIGPGVIVPGASSAVLVVQTNAPAFTETVASVIDGFVTMVPTFSPVPEPAAASLLALGSLFIAARRRRR